MLSHLDLEFYTSCGPRQLLMGVALFDCKPVGVHCTRIVELVSSALDALKLESFSFIQSLRPLEHSGTIFSANPDSMAHSPDRLS